jgi:hypothetical protein
MKRFIAITMVFLAACAPGTMTQLSEKEKIIETVIEFPGISRDDIYDSSRKWIAETLQSPRAVIDYENSKTDTIIGNGIIPYPCKGFDCVVRGNWNVAFTLKIEARENMATTTFSKLQLSMPDPENQGSGSYNPGRIAPVWNKADMADIRPALLKFNGQLRTYVTDSQVKRAR